MTTASVSEVSSVSIGTSSTGVDLSARIGQVFLDLRQQRLHFLNQTARRLRAEGVPVMAEDLADCRLEDLEGKEIRGSKLPLVVAWREGRPVETSYVLIREGKPSLTVSWTVTPYQAEDGELLGIFGSFCLAPVQPNWQGMAELAHDLRTPLNALNLLAAFMDRQSLSTDEVRAGLSDIKTAVQRALNVSGELLDMCRGPAQRERPMESLWFSLAELIHGLVREQTSVARDKGLELKLDLKEAGDWQIYTNPTRLGRIISNLLENAVRYTNAGGVSFSATWRAEETGGKILVLSVEDTGSGIPAAEKGAIFQRYERGEAGRKSDAEGLGLGLSVVDHLVSDLDLELEVESESGRGSVFRLLLPSRLLRQRSPLETGTLANADTKPELPLT
jgi:two-component sensor histidine kinase